MNSFGRLLRNLREELGGLGEDVSETLYGNRTVRTLDRQIRDADEQLHAWRDELAAIKARRYTRQERVDALAAAIHEHEAKATKALKARRSKAAQEFVHAIVELETDYDELRAQLVQLDLQSGQLRDNIEHGESSIRRLKQQLDIVRTTQGILNAQATVAKRQAGEDVRLHTAVESAARIRRKQPSGHGKDGQAAPAAHADTVQDRAQQVLQRIQKRARNAAAKTSSASAKANKEPSA